MNSISITATNFLAARYTEFTIPHTINLHEGFRYWYGYPAGSEAARTILVPVNFCSQDELVQYSGQFF